MTPVFCCGFECGQFGSVGQHWSTLGSGASVSTSTVRSGARSIRLNLSAAQSPNSVSTTMVSSGTVLVGRFYVYFTTLPTIDYRILNVNTANETNSGNVLFKSSDSKIYAANNTTTGSTGVSVTTGVWYLIDFYFNCTANPRTMDVQVNGVACGQSTNAIAASTITQFFLFGTTGVTTVDVFADDVIVSQTSGDYPIGAGYVNHFVPTADGTHNVAGAADFRRGNTTTDITNATTNAYLLVDDVPLDDTTPDTDDHIRIVAPPNATDYVECIYGPAPGISTPTKAPRAVEVIAEFFAAGTGAADEIIKLNDNGTVDDVYNGTGVAGTTTGIYKRKHYATPPTGGAWTVVSGAGNFNNIRFRYGYASDANPDKSLMCTMIEAEFAEDTGIPNKIVQLNQAVKRAAYW